MEHGYVVQTAFQLKAGIAHGASDFVRSTAVIGRTAERCSSHVLQAAEPSPGIACSTSEAAAAAAAGGVEPQGAFQTRDHICPSVAVSASDMRRTVTSAPGLLAAKYPQAAWPDWSGCLIRHQGLLCLLAFALTSSVDAKQHRTSPSQTQLLLFLLQAIRALKQSVSCLTPARSNCCLASCWPRQQDL